MSAKTVYIIVAAIIVFLSMLMGSTLASATVCLIERRRAGIKWANMSRSHCDSCGHVLSVVDLIPVIGYLLTKGKCRYCGNKIPVASFRVELIWGGILGAVVASLCAGASNLVLALEAAIGAVLCVVFLVLATRKDRAAQRKPENEEDACNA